MSDSDNNPLSRSDPLNEESVRQRKARERRERVETQNSTQTLHDSSFNHPSLPGVPRTSPESEIYRPDDRQKMPQPSRPTTILQRPGTSGGPAKTDTTFKRVEFEDNSSSDDDRRTRRSKQPSAEPIVPRQNRQDSRRRFSTRQRRSTLTLEVLDQAKVDAEVRTKQQADNMSVEDAAKLLAEHPGICFSITNEEKGTEWTVHCTTPEELVGCIKEDPEEWFWAIANLSETWRVTAEKVKELDVKFTDMQTAWNHKVQECKEVKQDLSQADNDAIAAQEDADYWKSKLQKKRDHWSQKEQHYQARVKEDWQKAVAAESWLQSRIDTLHKELQAYQNPHERSRFSVTPQRQNNPVFPGFGDMDEDTASIRTSYPTQVGPGQGLHQQSPHPSGAIYGPPGSFNTASAGGNHRYPDAPMFNGEPGSKLDYEDWKEHIYSKLEQSAQTYDTPWSRIEYARIKTEGLALDVIKTRARRNAPNKYISLEELFEEMDAHFLDHNAKRTAKAKLTNGSIKMKEHQSFSDWYPRFTAILAPVFGCDEGDRKDYLNSNLNTKLRNGLKGTGNFEIWSYAQCVNYCRQWESLDDAEVKVPNSNHGMNSSSRRIANEAITRGTRNDRVPTGKR
jgi:hypothetical protein